MGLQGASRQGRRAAVPAWVVFLASTLPQVLGGCVPVREWRAYGEVDVKARCPDFDPSLSPDYARPLSCASDAVIEDLAFSIANEAFECNKWCVFSIKPGEPQAWKWNNKNRCWDEDKGCFSFAQEKRFADDRAKALCKECTPVRNADDLSMRTVREKCPAYQATSRPRYHTPVQCGGGDNQDLKLSLANGAYAGCNNWCVFSLKTPDQRAWMWDDGKRCWNPTDECLKHKAELAFVNNLKAALCEEPCKPAKTAGELSLERIREKCPRYQADSHPQYHNAHVCSLDSPDEELQESLANFAFATCTAWCVFSIHRPDAKAWIWNANDRCWNEQNTCLAIASEHAFVADLRNSLCLAPRTFPADGANTAPSAQGNNDAPQETNKGPAAVPGNSQKAASVHDVAKETRQRQIDAINQAHESELFKAKTEADQERRRRAEESQRRQAERRKAKFGKKAKEDEAKQHAGERRSKDPVQESYKIFGGLVLVLGSFVLLSVCTGDDSHAKRRHQS